MPGMNGLEGLARVREAAGDAPVAIMSGSASRDDIQGAMNSGAAGFSAQNAERPVRCWAAIRLIMTGERFFPASTFTGPISPAWRSATRPCRSISPGGSATCWPISSKGHSNKEIARALDLQEVTVKLHVRGLCRKLNAKNRTQAVLNARDLGITVEVGQS